MQMQMPVLQFKADGGDPPVFEFAADGAIASASAANAGDAGTARQREQAPHDPQL